MFPHKRYFLLFSCCSHFCVRNEKPLHCNSSCKFSVLYPENESIGEGYIRKQPIKRQNTIHDEPIRRQYSRESPIKRRYSQTFENDFEDELEHYNIRKRREENNNISQFAVDFIELTDNEVLIQMTVNHKRYEGVLQSCRLSNAI